MKKTEKNIRYEIRKMKYRQIMFCSILIPAIAAFSQTKTSFQNLYPNSAKYFFGAIPTTITENMTCLTDSVEIVKWRVSNEYDDLLMLQTNEFWMRLNLPDSSHIQPGLYFEGEFQGIEIYQGKQQLYRLDQRNPSNLPGDRYRRTIREIVQLQNIHGEHFFYIRFMYNNPFLAPSSIKIYVDDYNCLQLYKNRAQEKELKQFLIQTFLSAILFFVGFAAIFIFFYRRRHQYYSLLYFGIMAVSACLANLGDIIYEHFLNIHPLNSVYPDIIFLNMIPLSILLLIEQIFGAGENKLIRRLWQFHSIYFLISLFSPVNILLLSLSFLFFYLFCTIYLIISIITVLKSKNKPRLKSPSVFIFFIMIFFITALNEIVTDLTIVPWDFQFFEWGLLSLVFAFGYIIIEHFETISHQVRSQQNEIMSLEQANLKAQYNALKSQIDPHFLFNTLGTILHLIEEDKDVAKEYVNELSKVYRYILQTRENELVTLKQELDFVKSYFFLLRKRFNKNLTISIDVPDLYKSYEISPVSVQLLVENAVKHNIISSKKPLHISISVDEQQSIVVKNNLQKKASMPTEQVGLKNLQSRYQFMSEKKPEIITDSQWFIVKIPLLKNEE